MHSRPDHSLSALEQFERLDALGILPPAASLSLYSAASSPVQGLLELWQEWLRLAPKNRRARAARVHSGLLAAVESGAELTFAILNRDRPVCESWLGQRAYWWPRGTLKTRHVGIVSSRLKRNSDQQAPVLRALRLSMSAVDVHTEHVVTSAGSSLHEYVEQCTTTFDVPLLRLFTPADRRSPKFWLDDILRTSGNSSKYELLLSPEVWVSADTISPVWTPELSEIRQVPVRDRLLALISERLFVMTLRRNGNWWKLLRAGLAIGLWDAGSVRAVAGDGLCPDEAGSDLHNHGAVLWYLTANEAPVQYEYPSDQSTAGRCRPSQAARSAAESTLTAELVREDSASEWLLHWTRAPMNEWAGEPREDHLSSKVLSEVGKNRSAFGTLQRIVGERVLRATSGNTRTNVDVVCFSELPLVHFLTKRVFRSHRGRWDFEHYGIGIRKQRFLSLGGRPVIYGDESAWRSLPEGERPWFQPSQNRAIHAPIDWTTESEWRLASSLQLSNLPDDDVFLFCRTEHEASDLRSACDWRVVSVETLEYRSRDPGEADE
tara:strand:+ start:310968 stop:312611 length:1644 start_codon:yes stop_codon:yes gene_type:complete